MAVTPSSLSTCHVAIQAGTWYQTLVSLFLNAILFKGRTITLLTVLILYSHLHLHVHCTFNSN